MSSARKVETMDTWSLVLFMVAGFIAVTALVRLMLAHRNRLLVEFRSRMRAARKRRRGPEAGGAEQSGGAA